MALTFNSVDPRTGELGPTHEEATPEDVRGDGDGGELWPLAILGAVSIPVGLLVFRAGERYAKRHGKLKRSG